MTIIGKCLFYKEWYRPLNTFSDDPDEDKKLMYAITMFIIRYEGFKATNSVFLCFSKVWNVIFIERFDDKAISTLISTIRGNPHGQDKLLHFTPFSESIEYCPSIKYRSNCTRFICKSAIHIQQSIHRLCREKSFI